MNIIQTFLGPTNCFARAGLPATRVILDVLSNLLDVIAPVIRPVSFQLMSQREKEEVVNLVDTLIDVALTYKPDGQVYGYGNQNVREFTKSTRAVCLSVLIVVLFGRALTHILMMGCDVFPGVWFLLCWFVPANRRITNSIRR